MRHLKYILFFAMVVGAQRMNAAESAKQIHNVIGCEIYSVDKKLLRKFPGEMCLFKEDGSVVSGQDEQLVYYNRHGDVVWSKKLKPHHQLNFSLSGQEILVIGSEAIAGVRFDVLQLVNLKGEVEKRFALQAAQKQFLLKRWTDSVKRKHTIIWGRGRFKDSKLEVTHVNSFYEIPDNSLEKKIPAFKQGNYIVNDVSLMLVFVLSRDLKQVLWQDHIREVDWTMLHDVQVLKNGNLLFYDNGTKEFPQSALAEHDLRTGKDVWKYQRQPRGTFYSPRLGGIQILENGNILFTDITVSPRSIEIDRDGREVWSMDSPVGSYLQQAKRLDLSMFLQRNGGL